MTIGVGHVLIDRGFMVEDPTRAAANREMIKQDVAGHPRRSWNLDEPMMQIKEEEILPMTTETVAINDHEKEKDAMLEDYRNPNLPVAKFLTKYHISTKTWSELKEKWNVKPKGRHHKNRKKPVISNAKLEKPPDTKLPTFPAPIEEITKRLDALSNHLAAMDLVLTSINQTVDELLSAGYMEKETTWVSSAPTLFP